MASNQPPRIEPGIPLLDLQAQYAPLREEILAAVTRVCDSQRFIMGPEIEALENELASMLRVRHAVAVSSGTDALLLALMALGIGRGDEVITTPYSFFATAGEIARAGATPVFVDIDARTYNIDASRIPAAITSKTKAVLPVHLFGLAADMDPIVEAASGARIPIIEDAAQAIGAAYDGRLVGGIGTCGCFSFYPSKNLGAFGDAGLFTTNDDQLAHRARLLREHGMERKYEHPLIGGNFRMDALQAAILRVKARHLPDWTDARRANAGRYMSLCRGRRLEDHIGLPVEPSGRRHIFNQFVIRISRRDDLRSYLKSRGVGTEIYYPIPLHLQPCFEYLGHRRGDFPIAERASAETLALPIFGELTPAQQEAVVGAIADFVATTATAAGGSARM
ncbi:MAG TPA: DegT/DnrJ/EryC1/StrS family aminotransferase [Vicinamibacterales bacterium]|nr:DegT/DnrJ/EryC1/StrS family aminotransferase [Vicinamibacterales bacterium]